jgi:uncharacterized membrane protein HdeD (DUF308 family)
MSNSATNPPSATVRPDQELRAAASEVTGYWWLWLLAGIAWITISLVILQFDSASVTTVGILIGLMFMLAAGQNFYLTSIRETGGWGWVTAFFGVMFLVSAVICFVSPGGTFATLADILGFLFVLVGFWWMMDAFFESDFNSLWWLRLIGGILMTIMGFWAAGQLFITKAYVLLVFAGIWALVEGINDITRAFAIREAHKAL